MSKIKEIKKSIENTLLNPPSTTQMLSDLRMHNMVLKQKEGDIGLFEAVNENLVERLWKTVKLTELLSTNSDELKKLGLNPKTLKEQKDTLIERINNSHSGLIQNQVEGFVKEGYLEFELFKNKKTNKN